MKLLELLPTKRLSSPILYSRLFSLRLFILGVNVDLLHQDPAVNRYLLLDERLSLNLEGSTEGDDPLVGVHLQVVRNLDWRKILCRVALGWTMSYSGLGGGSPTWWARLVACSWWSEFRFLWLQDVHWLAANAAWCRSRDCRGWVWLALICMCGGDVIVFWHQAWEVGSLSLVLRRTTATGRLVRQQGVKLNSLVWSWR